VGNQTGPPHSDLKVLISRGAPRRSGARLRGCPAPTLLPTATSTTPSTAAKAATGRIGQSAITTLAVALLDAAPGYGLGSTPPSESQ